MNFDYTITTEKSFDEAVKAVEQETKKAGFRANLHRTYIGSIERAEQNVSVDNIHKLAKALKVSADELFK